MEDERGYSSRGEKPGDRGRGRVGRRRDRGYRDRNPRGRVAESLPPQPQQAAAIKTPIILTKTATDRGQESPVKHILLKTRDSQSEDHRAPSEGPSHGGILPVGLIKGPRLDEDHPSVGAEGPSLVSAPGSITIQRSSSTMSVASTASGSTDGITPGLSALRITTMDREQSQCIRLLDENLHWTDAAMDMLAEQSDFLVVGAIGLQGTGKSTILSMLAGATPQTEPRSYLFSPQSKQTQETGCNQTFGVNIGVTTERIILLDTQPLLSPALLDHLIHHDRSIPSDFSSPENYNEMQIVTFLLTVCHVILVVQDWFTDVNLLRLLRTAEMLKPSSVPHTSSHDSGGNSGSPDNMEDHYPEVVFVYNKCTREDYDPESVEAMHSATAAIFQHSRLRYLSGISLLGSGLLPYSQLMMSCEDVNVHLVPAYESPTNGHRPGNGVIPAYRGHPSYEMVIESLRNQVFSIHRHPLTHHTLTEKNWFHYAARSWDTIRKSSLISEYNRLLTS